MNRLRHPKEKISKSSIVPSKIVGGDRVEIRHELDIQPFKESATDPDSIVVLFPSEDARDVQEIDPKELKSLNRVVIIDCTWNQTKDFLKHPVIQGLKKVKIQTEKTVFWRY